MDKSFFKRAAWESVKCALLSSAFCLFAVALFAIIVRATSPSQGVITAVNWIIKCIGIFFFSLLCIKKERSFFKGMAAGILSVFFTMFLFAAIGGGFHLNILFLPEILLCALVGGLGALLGGKLRKE